MRPLGNPARNWPLTALALVLTAGFIIQSDRHATRSGQQLSAGAQAQLQTALAHPLGPQQTNQLLAAAQEFVQRRVRAGGSAPKLPRLAPEKFSAPAAGVLPANGRPTVAGIRLPEGQRAGNGLPLWSSDRPVSDALLVAARLAEAFPRTGLWPVLWLSQQPAASMDGPVGLRFIGRVNVAAWMKDMWRWNHQQDPQDPLFVGPFPGIASAQSPSAATENPFVILDHSYNQLDPDLRAPYELLLIPARRPADTVAITGLALSDTDDAVYSAVLRSWEDRFGAFVTIFDEGSFTVAAASPPSSPSEMRRLADEFAVVDPPDPSVPEVALIDGLKGLLNPLSEDYPAGDITPRTWSFGFGP
jgi:hypothetical protein